MKFLVIGDIMIDRYLIGEVNRISPEAPVQIVDVKYQYDVLGGAANCARNISTITGKDTVEIAGAFGQDEAGEIVQKLLKEEGIDFWYMPNNKPTTVKERIFASNQQLLRIDLEDREEIEFYNECTTSIDPTHEKLNECDYIIVSDYAKGVVTQKLMDWIGAYSNKIIIDPKPENCHLYPSCVLLVTPNESEYKQMNRCWRNPDLPQHILITRGKNGMELQTDQWSKIIESKDVPNCEVMGAGDTVAAMMAISLQRGVDIVRAAKIANACAGYVVSQPGTAVVPKEVYENIFIKESL